MTLTPIDRKELSKFYKRTKNYAILREFQDSDADAARIDDHDFKTASMGATSLNASIKRYSMNTLKAVCADGQLYLLRLKPEDAKNAH